MSELESRHYLANGEVEKPEARDALEWARETTAKMVDLKFCDLLGTWQHVTLPIRAFDESAFDEIFRSAYAQLVGAANVVLRDAAVAEEIAQDVMLELWRRRETLVVEDSLRAYLVRNGLSGDQR